MFDLIILIKTVGYIGMFSIIFAESGLLIGFFLPGDSLLFTAGFLSSQGYLNIWILTPLVFIAAVTGDSVGYWFGKKVGPRIFSKEESLIFNPENVHRTNQFFIHHGKKSLILARFLPVIRTFTPILAGVGKMKYSIFLAYNIIGGLLWSVGVTLLGYFLGTKIPNAEHYLFPIILIIVFISLAPTLYHLLKDESSRRKIKELFKKLVK